MPNKILPTIIVAQFVKIQDKNSDYISETYNIFDKKIRFPLDICYIATIKQLQFYAVFLSFVFGQAKDYFVYNVHQNMMFAEMYSKIKIYFDVEVNKIQYNMDCKNG